MRSGRLVALPLLALLALPVAAAPAVAPRSRADLTAELGIATRTRDAIAQRLEASQAALGKRVRALYKLTRAGLLPLVADQGARADLTRRRALARRLIVRDLEERAALAAELARAEAQVAAAEAQLAQADRQLPDGLELASPVARAPMPPRQRDEATGARLLELDARFAAGVGEAVRAPASGVVRYAGRIHGRGNGVVLALGNGVSLVVSGLTQLLPREGERLEAGAPLGRAGEHGLAVALYVGDRAVPASEHF